MKVIKQTQLQAQIAAPYWQEVMHSKDNRI
jgi:hypothetical protein